MLKWLIGIGFSVILSGQAVWGQSIDDTTVSDSSRMLFYFGPGFGVNTRGANIDLAVTLTSKMGIGASFNLMFGYVGMKNVPADYYDGLFRFFRPSSDFSAASINFVYKFPHRSRSFRMGVEAGPSFISYNKVSLEINPQYPDLFEYKYNKTYKRSQITGMFCMIKAEVPALTFLGVEFGLFGLFNGVQTIAGFDVLITLGRVR